MSGIEALGQFIKHMTRWAVFVRSPEYDVKLATVLEAHQSAAAYYTVVGQ